MAEHIINIIDVVDVTADGLLFKNDSGAVDKILFDECRKNWVSHVNAKGFVDWSGNPVHITFEESKCIGERNMIAEPPYILLYSDNRLKIVMKPAGSVINNLSKVQKEIFAVLYSVGGVTTFDMT